MTTRPVLIAGNWKMNGTATALAEIATMADAVRHLPAHVIVAVCLPATLIDRARHVAGNGPLVIGAQDVHPADSGAFTGSVSVAMLADAGATMVIVGHSERRADCFEDDATIKAKAEAVLAGGLTAVVCVGESGADRDAGTTLTVIGAQLDGSLPSATGERLAVAYEPVWAIGTGRTPSLADIAEVHGYIRARLVSRYGERDANTVGILYGGSVKPANAAEILAIEHVDGALVGGASLTARDFLAIVEAS
ncbi:MAG: triose-phosphate isomerase [Janthinobacterium lividum]